jgi:hypothetical protein
MKCSMSALALTCALAMGVVGLRAQGGSDLAGTPQGKVVLAYYKAAHAGDAAAIKKLVTEDSGKDLDGAHGKDLLGMLKEMLPVVTPKITKVNVTGKMAAVDAEYKDGATTTIDHHKLVLVGTEWRIDMHAR